MRVKDTILVSDMDGTIIPITGVISQKNINAINKFRDLGGIFTIATGRSPASGNMYFSQLGVDGIIIANNGATIYDVKNEKTLWCKYLDDNYKEIVKYVKTNFPNVGIELITDDGKYYIASENKITNGFVRGSDFTYSTVDESEYPDNCCKVLFVADPSEFDSFVSHIREQEYEDVVLVESGGTCFEMMCSGISKGYPFERLVALYDKKIENSAAIGDYYNDIEMIEKANVGAAVGNAVQEAKAKANIIVKSCEDDGLADFIDYLIEHSDK